MLVEPSIAELLLLFIFEQLQTYSSWTCFASLSKRDFILAEDSGLNSAPVLYPFCQYLGSYLLE